MAASFTVAQQASSDLLITDTSTGMSGTGTRRLYIKKYDGSYYNPLDDTSYIDFPYADGSTIEIPMDRDYALTIRLWILEGSTITQTDELLYGFKFYSLEFLLSLLSVVTAQPSLSNNPNFNRNYLSVAPEIDNATQAVTYGEQLLAQAAYDRIKALIDNPEMFF